MPEATSDALMGLGMPAQLAALMGANPAVLAGVGTANPGAAVLKSRNTEVTASAGNTAVSPPATSGVMEPYFLFNSTATAVTAVVCVPVGHTLNGALNGTLNLAQNKAAILWQYKPKFWASILTA